MSGLINNIMKEKFATEHVSDDYTVKTIQINLFYANQFLNTKKSKR